MVPPAEPRSYYGEPVVARPVWTKEVPLYLWAGGIAGAAAPLTLLASLRGDEELARRAAATALVAGGVVSPVLLISDLGVPKRFLYMLRVFKVTSPMSVGVWILSGFGVSAGLAAARELLGLWPRTGRAAEGAGLLLGPALATYTGALVANSAIPVWAEARRELPFVFGASAVATAGALLSAITPSEQAGPPRRMAVGGAAVELAAFRVMERRLGPFIAEPYHRGAAGRLARAAKGLTAAGAAVLAGGGRRREATLAGGLGVLAGGLLGRWAVFRAGFASADDPKYTVGPQRERSAARARAARDEPPTPVTPAAAPR